MSLRFWRRPSSSDVEVSRDRADRLDAALSSWQAGEHPWPTEFDHALEAVEPLGDALAAAQALDALGAGEPLPHEPLVTLRAALAARRATPALPLWRRLLTQPRFAPAVAAVVAAVLAVGVLSTVRTTDQPLTHVAAAKAQAFLETAQDRVEFLEAQTASATTGSVAVDPATLNDAVVEAQAAAASARAAAQLATGEERKTLLAQVELQQRQINALRTKVLLLAGAPNLVPDGEGATAIAAATTTTVKPTTTTTEAPTTTTTVKPTTTTVKPTTTTAAPTTTTTAPPETTTTSSPDTTTTSVASVPRNTSEKGSALP
jgi:hypothetical protein